MHTRRERGLLARLGMGDRRRMVFARNTSRSFPIPSRLTRSEHMPGCTRPSIEWIPKPTWSASTPGAEVHHPNWDLGGQTSDGCRPDGVCILQALITLPIQRPRMVHRLGGWLDGRGHSFTPAAHLSLPAARPAAGVPDRHLSHSAGGVVGWEPCRRWAISCWTC
jgi:hypothetical protein